MKYLAYRNLIGVSHTEAEAKEEATGVMVRECGLVTSWQLNDLIF